MASLLVLRSHMIAIAALISLLLTTCHCFNPKLFNVSTADSDSGAWLAGGATWYGAANGDGSEGGACGFKDIVGKAPINSLIAAGGPSLYNSGKSCGACYEVKCESTANAACSGNSVTVVITDECPAGGACSAEAAHFDLSGTAFGDLAVSGQSETLRNAGVLKIQYRRVQCKYPGQNLNFQVDAGSNKNYLAVLATYVDGAGDVAKLELQEAGSTTWESMDQSWGDVYKANAASSSGFTFPVSLRLTTDSGQSVVAKNIIPADWTAGQTYTATVNVV
ncbi:putative expansin-B2 [Malania oleifera]|uniref:putative expansin-B2 n=1 Tax=Malania oleifera TaxID=397392 RepID=UPI0025AE9990|nr:putative expansin-B2 [Malania oleifera]